MKKNRIAALLLILTLFLTSCAETTKPTESPAATASQPVQTPPVETAGTPPSVIERLDENERGNTSGNISNDAFAALFENNIYCISPASESLEVSVSEITKTDLDGGEKAVLASGEDISCLNVTGGWIYYIGGSDGLIYKLPADGSESARLVTRAISNVETMTVIGEQIYCRARDSEGRKSLYSVQTDGGETRLIQPLGSQVSGFAVHEGWIYFSVNKTDAWETYRVRTDGSENTKLADACLYCPSIADGKIFYIQGDDSQIFSMNLDGSDNTLFAGGVSAVKLNADGGWLYYTDTAAIYKIKTDGAEKTKLCDFPSSNFISLNVIGDWIYISGNGIEMQRVKTEALSLFSMQDDGSGVYRQSEKSLTQNSDGKIEITSAVFAEYVPSEDVASLKILYSSDAEPETVRSIYEITSDTELEPKLLPGGSAFQVVYSFGERHPAGFEGKLWVQTVTVDGAELKSEELAIVYTPTASGGIVLSSRSFSPEGLPFEMTNVQDSESLSGLDRVERLAIAYYPGAVLTIGNPDGGVGVINGWELVYTATSGETLRVPINRNEIIAITKSMVGLYRVSEDSPAVSFVPVA
ncbi:MAG: DUF5050 domain-containing protein [Oscillospiraceae bacterium]|jgi:hypothetical protein|nr:DUF5050 domain-containing protein [Oscillospiraceae bacterium]